MMENRTSAQTKALLECLIGWVERRLEGYPREWFSNQRKAIAEDDSPKRLFIAFSRTSQLIGKAPLNLSSEEQKVASELLKCWSPEWTLDQCVRTALILSFPSESEVVFVSAIEKLFAAAELNELIALYQSLPLLPYGNRFIALAEEGVRSNITPVFEAVALRNIFPAEHFDQLQWNQLVLKALFVGSPLSDIERLDQRANSHLARMAVDFARERRAARRTVPAELWRLVGPFIDESNLADIRLALAQPDNVEQRAAALALSVSRFHLARDVYMRCVWKWDIEEGRLSWHNLVGKNLEPDALYRGE